MPENMSGQTRNPGGRVFHQGEGAKTEGSKDTISQLFDDRDRASTEVRGTQKTGSPGRSTAASVPEKPPASLEPKPQPEAARETAKPLDKGNVDDGADEPSQTGVSQTSLSQAGLSEAEALRAKLEKTEKVLAENQRYGRTNAQKLKNALKAVRKFADDGVLAEEEAKELLGTLHSGIEEPEDESIYQRSAHPSQASLPQTGVSQASLSQTNLFAPIFEVANKELQNIFKYTDDGLLHDKVKAFDYFLSVGSKEEISEVFEDLTSLMDDPLQLTKKMLSIGATVYEGPYKGIKEAGGFRQYLAGKEETIEKMQKKVDKLEKKLLQYEDFDKPRYRIDETGSPGMGDEDGSDGSSPATDTLSALFEERDRRPQGRRMSGPRSQGPG